MHQCNAFGHRRAPGHPATWRAAKGCPAGRSRMIRRRRGKPPTPNGASEHRTRGRVRTCLRRHVSQQICAFWTKNDDVPIIFISYYINCFRKNIALHNPNNQCLSFLFMRFGSSVFRWLGRWNPMSEWFLRFSQCQSGWKMRRRVVIPFIRIMSQLTLPQIQTSVWPSWRLHVAREYQTLRAYCQVCNAPWTPFTTNVNWIIERRGGCSCS